MPTPNGQGGWDLTDEDVAEIQRTSFGPDAERIGQMVQRGDIKEQTLYVPYSEDVLASVWAVDRGLQMFSNVPEDLAKMNAEEYKDKIIYFFAELGESV